MRTRLALASLMLAFVLLMGPARASISLEVGSGGDSLGPGDEFLSSVILISFDELVPKSSRLLVQLVDEQDPRGSVSLETYLHDEDHYDFRNQTFSYNITAGGTIGWEEYPVQEFQYRVSVSGLCGGTDCLDQEVYTCQCPESCTPIGAEPFPCEFNELRPDWKTGYVDGNPEDTGLLQIEEVDFRCDKSPCDFVEGSVVWEAEKSVSSPGEVQLTMREACGIMKEGLPFIYNGKTVSTNGWIIQEIGEGTDERCVANPGFGCTVELMPFDHQSMSPGHAEYGGPPIYGEGGVYGNGEYMFYGDDVIWNGSTGDVTILSYSDNNDYVAAYLPPNGHNVCAYTSHSEKVSQGWSSESGPLGASAGYGEPYSRGFTVSELGSSPHDLEPPDCPPYVYEHLCEKGAVSYGAVKVRDPDGSIELSYGFAGDTLTVSGTTEEKMLESKDGVEIDLGEFDVGISDLTERPGSHPVRLILQDGGEILAEGNFTLFVCNDSDLDGFCKENGDCDDGNPNRSPGLNESCDGLDNDCDGEIDEDIAGMGEKLGKACNDWNGSVCKGTWTCNAEGTDLVCTPSNGVWPGSRPEVCNNDLDDDCDGTADETDTDTIDGIKQPKCSEELIFCNEGQKRSCGDCGDGKSYCVNGAWGPCRGGTDASPESCNRVDDDCDGIVDNLYGMSSVEGTRCYCYDGQFPRSEFCNNLDDDCDGEIDEGPINCCREGQKRSCGVGTGSCEPGIQRCRDSQWGPCEGGIGPEQVDMCCDGLDNDCDGAADEGCDPGMCGGGATGGDGSMEWRVIGIGVLLLIGVVIYREFRSKKG